ncbi:MAG TPA: DUF3098 domain-containing protein [Flavobacteriaceae bacterium]|nr:DUF3098 domain-containing protein [Flavobacteriaceae bacterium]|tara:strand:- start:6037 stop:6279 length:243 start_codon:yes stop_codon:yes gene_type:complete
MKEKKSSNKKLLFTKKNYLISCIGLIFILIGFIIMSGGESNDPNIFNEEIYNFTRIRIAPLLIVIGLSIQVYAILFSSKK